MGKISKWLYEGRRNKMGSRRKDVFQGIRVVQKLGANKQRLGGNVSIKQNVGDTC